MIKTNNNNVYVVMYHYVREIKNSKFSNLKGLEFRDFKKQIDYFLKNFNIISHSDFAEIIESKKIPKKMENCLQKRPQKESKTEPKS